MTEIKIDLPMGKLSLLQKYMTYYIDKRVKIEDFLKTSNLCYPHNQIISFEQWCHHNLAIMKQNQLIEEMQNQVWGVQRNLGIDMQVSFVDDLSTMNKIELKKYLK